VVQARSAGSGRRAQRAKKKAKFRKCGGIDGHGQRRGDRLLPGAALREAQLNGSGVVAITALRCWSNCGSKKPSPESQPANAKVQPRPPF
jgi:hypothetical protein